MPPAPGCDGEGPCRTRFASGGGVRACPAPTAPGSAGVVKGISRCPAAHPPRPPVPPGALATFRSTAPRGALGALAGLFGDQQTNPGSCREGALRACEPLPVTRSTPSNRGVGRSSVRPTRPDRRRGPPRRPCPRLLRARQRRRLDRRRRPARDRRRRWRAHAKRPRAHCARRSHSHGARRSTARSTRPAAPAAFTVRSG